MAFLFDQGSALFSQRLAHGEHSVAHAFVAGAEDFAGLNALQVLADGRAAALPKARERGLGIAARGLTVRQQALDQHRADQRAAGRLHAAHTAAAARGELFERFLRKRKLIGKGQRHRLRAVAARLDLHGPRRAFFDRHDIALLLSLGCNAPILPVPPRKVNRPAPPQGEEGAEFTKISPFPRKDML